MKLPNQKSTGRRKGEVAKKKLGNREHKIRCTNESTIVSNHNKCNWIKLICYKAL